MPITYGPYTRQLKLLPLTLHAGGGATVVVRFGYVGEDGIFVGSTEQTFAFDESVASGILDAQPSAGLSRRDDLSLAIYTYLVTSGLIEAGDIS